MCVSGLSSPARETKCVCVCVLGASVDQAMSASQRERPFNAELS